MTFRLLSHLFLGLFASSAALSVDGDISSSATSPHEAASLFQEQLQTDIPLAYIQDNQFWELPALDWEDAEELAEGSLFLYPSPAQNWVNIEWQYPMPGEMVDITFYDLEGRKMYHTKQAADHDISLALRPLNLPSGI